MTPDQSREAPPLPAKWINKLIGLSHGVGQTGFDTRDRTVAVDRLVAEVGQLLRASDALWLTRLAEAEQRAQAAEGERDALVKDAKLWRKWMPWFRTIQKAPWAFIMDVREELARAASEKGR